MGLWLAQVSLGDPGSLGLPRVEFNETLFGKIINALIVVAGMLALLFIIVGGFKYVVSGGDPGGTKGAKDTILYAVIGLILALVSFAIVNFIVSSSSS